MTSTSRLYMLPGVPPSHSCSFRVKYYKQAGLRRLSKICISISDKQMINHLLELRLVHNTKFNLVRKTWSSKELIKDGSNQMGIVTVGLDDNGNDIGVYMDTSNDKKTLDLLLDIENYNASKFINDICYDSLSQKPFFKHLKKYQLGIYQGYLTLIPKYENSHE